MTLVGYVEGFGVEGTGDAPSFPPSLTSATALTITTVRVSYDMEVYHVNASNSNDALNPSNYVFTGSGEPVAAVSVALNQASPTIVDITLDGEMTGGATYRVTVSNVENLTGEEIEAPDNFKDFTGLGIRPEVTGAAATDSLTVRITFNEDMKNNVDLTDIANYSFTGGLAASAVVRINSTMVDVTVNEMTDSASYTVTVTNVVDLGGNEIAVSPDNQAVFSGIGIAPQLSPTVVPIDAYSFYIDYTETVKVSEATDAANYDITPPLGTITPTQVTGVRYKIATSAEQGLGVPYTITVTDVHDMADNLIDPANDSASWQGFSPTRPLLYVHPEDESEIYPRQQITVQAVDRDPGASGVDLSTWNIWLTLVLDDGLQRIYHVLQSGVANTNEFEVSWTGDVDDATDGIYVHFLPKSGHWEPNARYKIDSNVQDNDATSSSEQWNLDIMALRCFEDILPSAESIDSLLLQEITAYPYSEQLRQLMLQACTESGTNVVRTRTLLWVAALTDIQTLVADKYDTSVLEDITICDAERITLIYQKLQRNGALLRASLEEVRGILGTINIGPIENYLQSASQVYAVSAAAALVILAATA